MYTLCAARAKVKKRGELKICHFVHVTQLGSSPGPRLINGTNGHDGGLTKIKHYGGLTQINQNSPKTQGKNFGHKFVKFGNLAAHKRCNMAQNFALLHGHDLNTFSSLHVYG